MASPIINFDTPRFKRAFSRYHDETMEALDRQTAIYHGVNIKEIIAFTPGPRDQADKSGMNEKKLGERAIENDFKKIFDPMTKGDISALKFMNLPHEIFNPTGDISQMETLHRSKRDNQGRVKNRKRIVTKRAGGQREFYNRMIVPRTAYDKYLKLKQKRVGMMKAAWIASIPGVKTKHPAWLTRHRLFVQVASREVSNGKFTYTSANHTPYARNKLSSAVHRAEFTVQKKFENSIDAVMKHLEKQFQQREAAS